MPIAVAASKVSPKRGARRSMPRWMSHVAAPATRPGPNGCARSIASPASGRSIIASSSRPAGTMVHSMAPAVASAKAASARALRRSRTQARAVLTSGAAIAHSHP